MASWSARFSVVWWLERWPRVWVPRSRPRALHQYALTTRSGCESIAHALQGLTDLDPEATVMSVDGVGAFDLISRASMMSALRNVPGCDDALPFVLQFYGQPSNFMWGGRDGQGPRHRAGQRRRAG